MKFILKKSTKVTLLKTITLFILLSASSCGSLQNSFVQRKYMPRFQKETTGYRQQVSNKKEKNVTSLNPKPITTATFSPLYTQANYSRSSIVIERKELELIRKEHKQIKKTAPAIDYTIATKKNTDDDTQKKPFSKMAVEGVK